MLPSRDHSRLLAQQVQLTLNHGQHPAETVLRALFSFEANRRVDALGGDVRLQLAGVNPVEISCGVVHGDAGGLGFAAGSSLLLPCLSGHGGDPRAPMAWRA